MKKLMIVSAALVAVTAQAGWGDLGKAAAKDATAATLKGLTGSKSDDARRTNSRCVTTPSTDAEKAEKAKKDEVSKKQLAKKQQEDAEATNVPGFVGKKFDWAFTDDWGNKTTYHTRIVSGDEIERRCDGLYQIQNFHNDNYGFSWVGFKSLADLEYAITQVDAYVKKCAGWQKIAIDNSVEGMRKEDDKTKFAIDKDGNRVEWFIFCTKKNKQGKIIGYFDVRWTDKHDQFMKGFNNLENDGCVEFWQKQVEACKKAVELYKTGLNESNAKAQKVKDTANLFN